LNSSQHNNWQLAGIVNCLIYILFLGTELLYISAAVSANSWVFIELLQLLTLLVTWSLVTNGTSCFRPLKYWKPTAPTELPTGEFVAAITCLCLPWCYWEGSK